MELLGTSFHFTVAFEGVNICKVNMGLGTVALAGLMVVGATEG